MPTRDSAWSCVVKRKICRRHLLQASLLLIFFCAFSAYVMDAAFAQAPPAPATSAKTNRVPQPSPPSWGELSPAQREALAPLSGMWETLEADRKKRWLEMASRFSRLTPEAQKRMHQRMGEYARLSPEQRVTARENFRRAYELPADQRQEKLQQYQGLPEDKKRALAEQAARKQAAPPPPSPAEPAPSPTTK